MCFALITEIQCRNKQICNNTASYCSNVNGDVLPLERQSEYLDKEKGIYIFTLIFITLMQHTDLY